MRDANANKKERKSWIGQLKDEVLKLKGICESKDKELANNKDTYEKEFQLMKDQLASLQKFLDTEKFTKEEVSKAAEECVSQLKKKYDQALVSA